MCRDLSYREAKMMRRSVHSRWRLVGALAIAVCGTFAVGCDGGDSGPSEEAIDNCVGTMSQVSTVTSVQALYSSGAISQRDIKHAAQLAGGVSEEAYEPVFGEKGNAYPNELIHAWEAARHNARVASMVGGLQERIAPDAYGNYQDLFESTCHDILNKEE
jgi:hypothetical protein